MGDFRTSSRSDSPSDWEGPWIDFEELPSRVPSVMLGDSNTVPVHRAWLSQRQGRWRLREWSNPFPGFVIIALFFAAFRFYRAHSDNEQARKFFDRAQERDEAFSQLKLDPSGTTEEGAVFELPYIPWNSALISFAIVVGASFVFNLWGVLRSASFVADDSGVVLGRKEMARIGAERIHGVYQVSGEFRGRFRNWDILQIGLLWRTDEGAIRMQAVTSVYDSTRAQALGQRIADALGVELLVAEGEPRT